MVSHALNIDKYYYLKNEENADDSDDDGWYSLYLNSLFWKVMTGF